jgi:hypothetical protein
MYPRFAGYSIKSIVVYVQEYSAYVLWDSVYFSNTCIKIGLHCCIKEIAFCSKAMISQSLLLASMFTKTPGQ